MTVFIDESGDLGSGTGSTRHITLAAIITGNPKVVERIPRKVRERRLRKRFAQKPELKFHNSDDRIRKAMLRLLAESPNVSVVCLCVDKREIGPLLRSGKDEACYHLFGTLAGGIVRCLGPTSDLEVVVDDRPCNRAGGSKFDMEVVSRFEREFQSVLRRSVRIRVSRLDSRRSKGLQVADFVSGAVQKKHEHGDNAYYDVIAGIVARERIIEPV